MSYNLKSSCWTVCETQSKAGLLLSHCEGLCICAEWEEWAARTLPGQPAVSWPHSAGQSPLHNLAKGSALSAEMGFNHLNCLWCLGALGAGWKERIPAGGLCWHSSYLMGLTAAAGPAHGSSSTLTTAGIHTFPWRADGLGHWKETQGTKISRK